MLLTGAQFGELKQALLDAYTGEELRGMLGIELGRNLDVIAEGDNR